MEEQITRSDWKKIEEAVRYAYEMHACEAESFEKILNKIRNTALI